MDDLYHVWFSTKGRRAALDGEVGDEVKRLLVETARQTGIRLLEFGLVADHAHLLGATGRCAAGLKLRVSTRRQNKKLTAATYAVS